MKADASEYLVRRSLQYRHMSQMVALLPEYEIMRKRKGYHSLQRRTARKGCVLHSQSPFVTFYFQLIQQTTLCDQQYTMTPCMISQYLCICRCGFSLHLGLGWERQENIQCSWPLQQPVNVEGRSPTMSLPIATILTFARLVADVVQVVEKLISITWTLQ